VAEQPLLVMFRHPTDRKRNRSSANHSGENLCLSFSGRPESVLHPTSILWQHCQHSGFISLRILCPLSGSWRRTRLADFDLYDLSPLLGSPMETDPAGDPCGLFAISRLYDEQLPNGDSSVRSGDLSASGMSFLESFSDVWQSPSAFKRNVIVKLLGLVSRLDLQ
jgi:hypothetical protein